MMGYYEKHLNAEGVIPFTHRHRRSDPSSDLTWEKIRMDTSATTLIFNVQQLQLARVSAWYLSPEAVLTPFLVFRRYFVTSLMYRVFWQIKLVAIFTIFVADYFHTLAMEVCLTTGIWLLSFNIGSRSIHFGWRHGQLSRFYSLSPGTRHFLMDL